MAADINSPIPDEWSKYVTQSAIGLEVIPDQLYDGGNSVTTTSLQLTYFNAVRANQSLSNMLNAGLLPNPQAFLIQGIRLFLQTTVDTVAQGAGGTTPATRANDLALIINSGRLLLTIGQKIYGPWRLWTIGAGTRMDGFWAVAGAAATNVMTTYSQLGGHMWGLFPNLMVAPLQNFQVDIFWPSALSTLSASVPLEVMFDGQRARAVQ